MTDLTKTIQNKPQRANLTQGCVNSIRAYILANNICAGDKLPSFQEWSELLGVSVLVVREAFRSLEALGFVDIQHGRGIFLRSVDQIDFLDFLSFNQPFDEFTMKEVVEARAMLDLAVLEACISRANQAAIDELEMILKQMYQDPSLVAVDSTLHRRFHQIMLEATGNRLLISIGTPLLNTFWNLDRGGLIILTEEPYSIDEIDHHAAYVEAIRNRDLSHSRELVDQHLFGACSKYQIFPLVSTRGDTEEYR